MFEYDQGYSFNYKNKRIGKSQYLEDTDFSDFSGSAMNDDGIVIFCESCGQYMNYYPTDNYFQCDGKYICPSCGTVVRESTPYNQLDRESRQRSKARAMEEKPEGCKACGGPYPDCVTSCNIYDG